MKVAYVLGTSTGGTGAHVAMLAAECAARGIAVTVYGPAQAGRRFFPADPAGHWAGPGEAVPGGHGTAENAPPGAPGGASRPGAARPGSAGKEFRPAGRRAGPGGTQPESAGSDHGPAAAHAGFVPVEIGDVPRPLRDMTAVLRLRRLLRRDPQDVVHAHGLRAGALAALALAGPWRAAERPAVSSRTAHSGAAAEHGAQSRAAKQGGAHSPAALSPPAKSRAARNGTAQGSAAGPPAAARRRPPLLVTVHNAPPASGPAGAVYLLLEWIVARRADAVCWVSADLAARLRRRGAADGGRALVPAPPGPPPSPDQRARARADMGEPGRPVVLAAGRLTAQKGFGVLLSAAQRWQRLQPRPVLAIAGEGPLRPALEARARAAGLPVRFLGQRGDVPALLAAADVVVVPGTWEGQPLIVQEALRAGTPLVASRTGGIPALTGEDGALLVPPGDPAALAGAVRQVLAEPDVAARLSAAAAARAAALPTPAAAAGAAIAAYERLISGSPRLPGRERAAGRG